jgi:DNA gyrase subunit B
MFKMKDKKKNIFDYKDDEMTFIESDIEKIQQRPSMYNGYDKEDGSLHICFEIIDNSRDECMKPDTPGDTIQVNVTDSMLIVKDNGRGIATNQLRKIFETLNAGSNIVRKEGVMSAGENGAGSTITTALSSHLKLVSTRPQEKKRLTLVYKEGKLVEETLEKYMGDEHGMYTEFKPSKKYLGTDKIPVDRLCEWIENFRYTLSSKINFEYTIRGKKHVLEHKRLYDYFDEVGITSENTMCIPYDLSCSGKLIEIVREESYNRRFNLEASIVYASMDYKGEDVRKSWMNMISTFNNGMHMNGFINGLSQYLTEKVIQKKPALKDEDLKKDILAHLQIVLKCETDCTNIFNSQEKSYVYPRPLLHAIEKAVYEEICKHPSHINDLVEIVIQNNRVRKAGEQARNVSKETKAIKSWEKPANFISCSSNDKRIIELSLCEGKSASGAVRSARDPKTQAIYLLQGKPLNAWNETLERVLQSRIWRDLIKVLGCGIGPTFNIKKLNYSRIVIQTDADVDGFQIRVLCILFFWRWMPEIITEGRLYIGEAPLYKIEMSKSGKKIYQYIANKTEYLEKCLESASNIKIIDDKFTSRELITNAFEYNSILHEVAISRSSNEQLLELIAFGFAKYGESVEAFNKNHKKWLNMASGTFKEIGYDESTHQIYGVYHLTDFVVVVDDSLIKELKYVIDAQKQYGLIIKYKYNNEEYASLLSDFFNFVEKRYPVIKDRYKGLGSNPAIATKETMMDPNSRRIIRINVSDAQHLARQLNILSGKSKEDIQGRKKLLDEFEFKREMLDN